MNRQILSRRAFLKGAAATVAGSALMQLTAFADDQSSGGCSGRVLPSIGYNIHIDH